MLLSAALILNQSPIISKPASHTGKTRVAAEVWLITGSLRNSKMKSASSLGLSLGRNPFCRVSICGNHGRKVGRCPGHTSQLLWSHFKHKKKDLAAINSVLHADRRPHKCKDCSTENDADPGARRGPREQVFASPTQRFRQPCIQHLSLREHVALYVVLTIVVLTGVLERQIRKKRHRTRAWVYCVRQQQRDNSADQEVKQVLSEGATFYA